VTAAAILAALAALAGCGAPATPRSTPLPTITVPVPSATPSPTRSPSASPSRSRPDHVLVVVFENKAYDQVIGSPDAPYLNSIPAAVLTDSHAVTHPSQPNYIALFSGSTHGVTDDGCPVRFGNAPNLGRQLLDAGLTFTGYSEDLPQAGFTGCSSDDSYAAKHNPWVDFSNLPASVNQPASALPTDYAQLPTVSFLVPNLCDDMHNCSVATGDAWARQHLDPYLRWAQQHNSLLIITFDEDDNGAGNHIATLVAGATVHPGHYSEPVTHYRVLSTVENLFGLPRLNTATPITDIFR
jgi:acid phosphatase